MSELSAENFRCRCCGACCRVPGYVRLTEADLEAMSAYFGMTPEAFADRYTDLSPTRAGLVLKGEPKDPCMFLTEDNLCRVHSVRPQQCRDYPARWRSGDIEAVCQAEKENRKS